MSKKTTQVQSNDPWSPAQPYILDSLADTSDTYKANQPTLQKDATDTYNTYGRLAPGAEAGITGAQGLVNDTVAGKYLNPTSNPYMQGLLDTTNKTVSNAVNGQFEAAGRYGSGAHEGVLTSKLADADNSLLAQEYDAERGRQAGAVGESENLMSGSQGLLNNAAQLPWLGVSAQNGGITQLSSPYGTKTATTTESNPGGMAAGLLGAGLSAAGAAGGFGALLSDERAKTDIKKVGKTDDGMKVVTYKYRGDPTTTHMGLLAQEVAKKKPSALGPKVGGLLTVDYGKVAA